jgi:protein-histidine pros-kinase
MKLLVKFSLVFIIVFGVCGAAASWICKDFLETNARAQVLREGELMMESALAVRAYTADQIRPLLEVLHRRDKVFCPQTVPSYAATETLNFIRAKWPEYTYKEATLNPTNPRDRAVEWESDLVSKFHNDSNAKELTGIRQNASGGESLFVAHPLRPKKSCLECHSIPAAAPASMVRLYGPNNGFNWKEGEVIGAQIVSVPLAVPKALASAAYRKLMLSLLGVALVTLIALNLVLTFTVIRPVTRLAHDADEISKGNLNVPELPPGGRDEIGMLAVAFNRMHRSLAKAMKMLDQ